MWKSFYGTIFFNVMIFLMWVFIVLSLYQRIYIEGGTTKNLLHYIFSKVIKLFTYDFFQCVCCFFFSIMSDDSLVSKYSGKKATLFKFMSNTIFTILVCCFRSFSMQSCSVKYQFQTLGGQQKILKSVF